MRVISALLVGMIAAAGAARAQAFEPLRLSPPKPGLWEMRTVVTTIAADEAHPGRMTRIVCEIVDQAVPDPFWDTVDRDLGDAGKPRPFRINTPSHTADAWIETHRRGKASVRSDEGVTESASVDIRRLNERLYVETFSTTQSVYSQWLYTRREVTRMRWLTAKVPPVDPNQIALENSGLYDPGTKPCRPINAREK
jgi:hypothetical protein